MWIFLFLPLAAVLIWLLLRDLRGSVAPFVAMPKEDVRRVFDLLEIQPDDRFIELGCGKGDVLCQLAEERGVVGAGVELDWFLVQWARFRTRGHGCRVLYGDLFDVDLRSYNKVYVYLMKRAYPRLQEKFSRELQPGSIVVVAGWPLDDVSVGHRIAKPGQTKFYVYRY